MSIDERLRLSIHAQLTRLIGTDEADALIAHIMPVPWRDVATHDDLRVTTAELRGEMQQFRGDLFAAMNTQMRLTVGMNLAMFLALGTWIAAVG